MDMLVFAERCSAAILDDLPNKMGDPGVPTISCLIGTQMFDQALCDLGASVSVMPQVCKTIMIAMLLVKSGLGSSQDQWDGLGFLDGI
jgi:hypothetical protein